MLHLEPSNLSNKSWTLGIGKGFLFILLFSSLKSEINLTVPFILGIIKVGTAHWELLIFYRTPILITLSTSFLRVGSLIVSKGIGLVQ